VKSSTQSVATPIEVPGEIEPGKNGFEVPGEVPKDEIIERMWLLWEHRRFLAKATFLGLIISSVIAFLIPKSYDSTARLMPPDTQSTSGMEMMAALAGSSGSSLGALAGDLLGMKSSGALFVEILSGRTVQDGIIGRFDLRKVYHTRYWADARNDLAKHTRLSEDRKSGVITIVVTDHDPHRAAAIAQAYVEELDHLVAQVSTSSARRERIFIEQRLQSVKHDLDNASQQFSEYASKNTAIDITEQGKAMVEAAARLEGELIAAQSELEGLEQIYTPENVRVRSARARVDELKQQLDKFSGVDSPPEAADSPNSPAPFPTIRQLPLLGVRWADLYRQTKIQEKVYELLTQQYELAKIQEAKEIPVVKILDAPIVPEKKSFPPRLLIMVMGALATLVAAGFLIIGSQVWRETDSQVTWKVFAIAVWSDMERAILPVRSRTNRIFRRNGKEVSREE
jgi:capsule polysaccharide export protein KpsE/RkpR